MELTETCSIGMHRNSAAQSLRRWGSLGGAILSSMLVSSISLSLLLRLNTGAPQFFLISLNSIRNRHCRAIAGQVATVLDMLITAVRQGELNEQSIRPTKRQRSERSEREQYEGGADHDHPPNCRTRSIDHSPRVFIPNSRQSRRRRPTSRGHADPMDRIAKRFCQRLALVVEVSLLGDVIEIEGIEYRPGSRTTGNRGQMASRLS
jgi:hypothetical protein